MFKIKSVQLNRIMQSIVEAVIKEQIIGTSEYA